MPQMHWPVPEHPAGHSCTCCSGSEKEQLGLTDGVGVGVDVVDGVGVVVGVWDGVGVVDGVGVGVDVPEELGVALDDGV